MKNKRKISLLAAVCMLTGALSIPAVSHAEDSTIMQTVTVGEHKPYYMYDFSTKSNVQAVLAEKTEGLGLGEYGYDDISTTLSAVMNGEEVAEDTALVIQGYEPSISLGTALDAKNHPYVKLLYKFETAQEKTAWAKYETGTETDFNAIGDTAWHADTVNVQGTGNTSLYIGTPADAQIKYAAMFNTKDEADSFDASVKSATVGGTAATVDPFAHTITVTSTASEYLENIAQLTANDVSLRLYSGASATAGAATVKEDGDNAVSELAYTITDITGKATAWTVRKYMPIKVRYQVLDFTDLPVTSSQNAYTGTDAKNGTGGLYVMPQQYGGPSLLVGTASAGNPNFPQVFFNFDKLDLSKEYYAKMLCKGETAIKSDGKNALFTVWGNNQYLREEATIKWNSGDIAAVTKYNGKWFNGISRVPIAPYERDNKWLRVLLHDASAFNPQFKYIALFETKEMAESYDPTVESATIGGQTAVIDPFKHTATVEYPKGTTAEQMKGLTEKDISYILYNHAALEKNHCKAELIAEEKVSETNSEISVYLTYKMTDLSGNEIIWKFRRMAKKDSTQAKYFVLTFDDNNKVDDMIGDGTISVATNGLVQNRPVNYSGPGLDMQSKYVDSNGTRNTFADVDFKFQDANPDKEYYAKVLWRTQGDFKWKSNDNTAYIGIYWKHNWPREYDKEYQWNWPMEEAPMRGGKGWVEETVKVPISNNSWNADTKKIEILVNATTVTTMKYIGIFETKEMADAYDATIESAFIGANEGTIDPFEHTVTFDYGDINSVKLSLIHQATIETETNKKPTAVKLGEVETVNGATVQKYTVTGVTGKAVTWTVKVGEEVPPTITVSQDGNKVTATYANAAGIGKKIIALYTVEGDKLISVNTSAEESVSIENIPAGTYNIKAFLWDSLESMTPAAIKVEKQVTVQ